jgi:DNA-binding SARP family transcriptional activator
MGEFRYHPSGWLLLFMDGGSSRRQIRGTHMRTQSFDDGADSDPGDVGRVSVRLLGGFEVRRDRAGLPMPMSVQRLVAFLALNPRTLMRTYVAAVLWPDQVQARADASLRSTLWRTRGASANLIESSSMHLRIARPVLVDVHYVIELVPRLMDPAAACGGSDYNPSRLAGELLPDWTDEEWLHMERERMRQLCLHGLEAQSARLMTDGRYGEAVEAALAAVRVEPLRESAHRRLIEIYMAEGNAAEALRQYDWYRRTLYFELGLEPSQDVTRLVHRFRAGPIQPMRHRHTGRDWAAGSMSR